jgi:hypothetical protein
LRGGFCFSPCLHLGICCGSVTLLLVCNLLLVRCAVLCDGVSVEACLLQSVKFLAVELIQLRVDVFDSVLGPRNNDVLDRVDW